jgi:hypothetical protein
VTVLPRRKEESIDQVKENLLQRLPQTAHPKIREVARDIEGLRDQIPGRGGPEHKYLQELIKRLGEEKGFRATTEKELSSGGRVDVALETDGKRIACQISITTTEDHELLGARHCLAEGFDKVLVVFSEERRRKKAQDHMLKNLAEDEKKQVSFLLAEEFPVFLENEAVAGKEVTVAGYKVKVKYRPLSDEEQKERKEALSHVVLESLKKLKCSGRD